MNQTIKFRVWDTLQNRMYYPDGQIGLCNNEFNYPELYQNFQVPDEKYWSTNGFIDKIENKLIVQQYIGLQDKNGKDIYDGDIVRYTCYFHEHDLETHIGEVYFEEGIFHFDKINQFAANDCNFNVFSLEVIGNIFENPELLKCQIN